LWRALQAALLDTPEGRELAMTESRDKPREAAAQPAKARGRAAARGRELHEAGRGGLGISARTVAHHKYQATKALAVASARLVRLAVESRLQAADGS
jgi:hypothetical protein